MKKKRFTEEQIAYALAQESTGETIAAIPSVPISMRVSSRGDSALLQYYLD